LIHLLELAVHVVDVAEESDRVAAKVAHGRQEVRLGDEPHEVLAEQAQRDVERRAERLCGRADRRDGAGVVVLAELEDAGLVGNANLLEHPIPRLLPALIDHERAQANVNQAVHGCDERGAAPARTR
jgi:hypothetical protein